jgi:alpha-1,2-mannosyltransferase
MSATPPARMRSGRALAIAAGAFVVALAAYLTDMAVHPLPDMMTWYDLRIYNNAGLLVREFPAMLYRWRYIKFTYTPFAALIFAGTSWLPWAVLKWLMTLASLAALVATAWLTFGGLGWRGRSRAAATFGVCAAGLWTEPVQRALHLGQIELVLMALIAWDLCQSDQRRWKGAGIGLAAGIKLVPLIFIPYLILAGKLRQAAVAAAMFAIAAAVGFAFLPGASVKWWLSGYFLNSGNVGGVGSLANQSVLGMIIRADGSLGAATPLWFAVAAPITLLGLIAAAMLHRSGQPVAGWLVCALTGVLVSPISWDHHWVWIVPVLAVLTDAAVRARGTAAPAWRASAWRAPAWWALAGAVTAIYGGWPHFWTGGRAFTPDGLLGFLAARPGVNAYHLHGIQVISWNLFVFAGLVMFAFSLVAAARSWQAERASPGEHDMPVA